MDFDFTDGKCPDLKVALDVVRDLSILVGTEPSATANSGHGMHGHWAVEDGVGDTGTLRAIVKRWGRLVEHAAEIHGVSVDGVFDLPRMMRIPESFNCKGLAEGEAPTLRVTAQRGRGGPLSLAELADRFDEAGVPERVDDRVASRAEVSPPNTWTFADQTCGYATKMLTRWQTDRPKLGGARNPFVYNRFVRLYCALRNGCITEHDFRRALDILDNLLVELVTTTEPRRDPKRFELRDFRKHGIARAASHTDTQIRSELGGHNHSGDPKAMPTPATPPSGQQGGPLPPQASAAPPGGQQAAATSTGAEPPTTWEAQDLSPWLDGTVVTPVPDMGMARSDGVRFLYPGKEHAVLGETESGKTWFALGCVVAELLAGNTVLYFHYEEGDPGSTIERLQLLGVDKRTIATQLRFVGPNRPPNDQWIFALMYPVPTLVVHDGINEAMALMGAR